MQRQLRILPSPLRLTFQSLMRNRSMVFIRASHWNKTIRVGLTNISLLLLAQGRGIEILNQTDNRDELVDDLVALITSMAARIYGYRASKWRSEQIRRCMEDAYS